MICDAILSEIFPERCKETGIKSIIQSSQTNVPQKVFIRKNSSESITGNEMKSMVIAGLPL
jgi:hypothetical protein